MQSPDFLTKKQLRQEILTRRDALCVDVRRTADARITARLVALGAFARARTVLAFMSIGSEFDTSALVAHVLSSGRSLVLPRVDRAAKRLRLHRVRDLGHDLAPGTWGIREPIEGQCAALDIAEVDFVVVPGVAFDSACRRLGYGGGFYDRLLEPRSGAACRAAAAYAMQLVEAVPVEAHDRTVDVVVTESDTIVRSDPGRSPGVIDDLTR